MIKHRRPPKAKPIEITKILFFIFLLFYFLKFNNLNGRLIGSVALIVVLTVIGFEFYSSEYRPELILEAFMDKKSPIAMTAMLCGGLYVSSYLHRP